MLHQRSRRYKAIFTIYTFIGYVLFVIMLALVVGSDNVGFQETSALISVPIGYACLL